MRKNDIDRMETGKPGACAKTGNSIGKFWPADVYNLAGHWACGVRNIENGE